MPIAMPEARSSGISFFIAANGIFCLVRSKNPVSKSAAKIARYSANSPEETAIFRTNGPSVPNIAIAVTIIKRGDMICSIILTPYNFVVSNKVGHIFVVVRVNESSYRFDSDSHLNSMMMALIK